MPPSVKALTPFEKRLRKIDFWKLRGHNPLAPNCYWATPIDGVLHEKAVCEACAQLRESLGQLVRGDA
ncbi:hypothetical protein FHT44_005162 [Mycolicibacterium sp. BK634]|nr:hypothetical protein [Mycolicibacterium sp. BK634]